MTREEAWARRLLTRHAAYHFIPLAHEIEPLDNFNRQQVHSR